MRIKLFKKKKPTSTIEVDDLTPRGVRQVGVKLPFNVMAEKQLPIIYEQLK